MCSLLNDAHNQRSGNAAPFTGNNIGDIWRNAQQQAQNGNRGGGGEDDDKYIVHFFLQFPQKISQLSTENLVG